MSKRERVYNFSPGPAMLPLPVLEKAQKELLNWRGKGISVMEVSHRSPEFMVLADEIEQDLRDLLSIPQNYKVLFLSGGAQLQFSAIPMNLLGPKEKMNYLCTGHWSELARQAAGPYGKVLVVADTKSGGYKTIPAVSDWKIDPEGAYLHYVENETIHGVEFPFVPEIGTDMPLVVDMSSNILSKEIDVSNFGLIYACAQKNMGPAGVTVVIVREDLLGKASPQVPPVYNYEMQAKAGSMQNTPPTFSWYMMGLNLKWIKEQGGVSEMNRRSQSKSKKLYDFIDQSSFYNNSVDPKFRSRMNVIFTLKETTYDKPFLEGALKHGLAMLKGHKVLGGMRASIYNSMPEEGVDKLIEFMQRFESENN